LVAVGHRRAIIFGINQAVVVVVPVTGVPKAILIDVSLIWVCNREAVIVLI
jgi:hypothetical protein